MSIESKIPNEDINIKDLSLDAAQASSEIVSVTELITQTDKIWLQQYLEEADRSGDPSEEFDTYTAWITALPSEKSNLLTEATVEMARVQAEDPDFYGGVHISLKALAELKKCLPKDSNQISKASINWTEARTRIRGFLQSTAEVKQFLDEAINLKIVSPTQYQQLGLEKRDFNAVQHAFEALPVTPDVSYFKLLSKLKIFDAKTANKIFKENINSANTRKLLNLHRGNNPKEFAEMLEATRILFAKDILITEDNFTIIDPIQSTAIDRKYTLPEAKKF